MDFDQVARGIPARKLRIAGRPKQGRTECYILLEEPEEPVQLHWKPGGHVPHYRENCPNCDGKSDPVPAWYIGGFDQNQEFVVVELTLKCFRSAQVASTLWSGDSFTGLLVKIIRADFERSPRVLRCDQRIKQFPSWPYETRRELARIWGIPVHPRLYQEKEA